MPAQCVSWRSSRQSERLGDRKHVPLGTPVSRVVTDHDGIQDPALRHLGGERSQVARDPELADSPVRFA